MKKILLTVLFLGISITSIFAQEIDGFIVIEKMHQKWKNLWPKDMAFEQYAISFDENENEIKTEIWQEIIKSPANLHIRYNGFETGNGMIFARDSVFNFENGELISQNFVIHYLLLLAFDVYFYEPSITIEKLKKLEFDLNKTCIREINKKQHYIVGTNDINDFQSNQFSIDIENLWLTDLIINRSGSLRQITLQNYELFGKYPVATEILFKTNGKLIMHEKYFNINFPKNVDDKIFEKTNFKTVSW